VRGLGTIINLLTVAAGGLVGVYVGHRFPERMRQTIMQGLGLATIAVGVVGFAPLFDADDGLRRTIILIASITVGAAVGEALRLEERLEAAGERLRLRFAASEDEGRGTKHPRFVEGFVIASTVFCAGPMTLLGGIEDGLGVSIRLLAIKATLDGIAAIGFASVYGWGVLASLITIAIYQGAITALAVVIDPLVTGEVIAMLGAIGGVLVLGIALRLLEIKEIRVISLTPALVLGPVAAGLIQRLF
jgi:uncharacterized membrane protein YqgA involved in biofilm formation